MLVEIEIARLPLHGSRSSLPYQAFARWAPGESAGSQTGPSTPARILIVEDDLLIASQIEAALTDAGFAIAGVVTTGEQAIKAVSSEPPDLAIVDIRLAGERDGIDTALELFRSYGVRCIFASAYSDQEARRRAEAAAPLGWLQKPYSMAALTNVVRTAIMALSDKDNR